MAAISLFSVVMPSASEGSAGGGAVPDGAAGFAAMMAGVGQASAVSKTAATDDAQNADSTHDLKEALRDADKDRQDQSSDDEATSTMALLGLPVLPSTPGDEPVHVDAAVEAGQGAGSSALPTGPATTLTPPLSSQDLPPNNDQTVSALSTNGSDAAALAPVLAALTDTLGKQTAVARPQTDDAMPSPSALAVTPNYAPSIQVSPAPHANSLVPAGGVHGITAPVTTPAQNVASVAETASQEPSPAAPPPLTTTEVLAARTPTLSRADTKATAGNVRPAQHRADNTTEIPTDEPAAATPASPTHPSLTTHDGAEAPTPAMAIDDAGQQLATGATDRQLDLARQGAWLDGIAHDIAATGTSSGTLRFQVTPQHLGTVAVELKRDDSGAAVTLTANSEVARTALSDATPQLIAEARNHGLTIANAQVDVGSGDAGSGRNASTDSQGRAPGGQSNGHHGQTQDTGFSAQTGTGGDTGRQSQTRSQPMPEYRSNTTRMDRGSADEAKASLAKPSARRPDARYA